VDLDKPLKIVVTGPECSGKSTLSKELALKLNEPWVPEYAVEYLNHHPGAYQSADLIAIAKGQLERIEAALPKANKFLIIDTGIEVIDVWHRDKIGPLPEELKTLCKQWKPDLYLLCKPDIPYEPHPQREDEHRRDELFDMYEAMLSGEACIIISGSQSHRVKSAIRAIERTMKIQPHRS